MFNLCSVRAATTCRCNNQQQTHNREGGWHHVALVLDTALHHQTYTLHLMFSRSRLNEHRWRQAHLIEVTDTSHSVPIKPCTLHTESDKHYHKLGNVVVVKRDSIIHHGICCK